MDNTANQAASYKKKSRSYNKAKQSNDPRDWQRYKSLKKQMQFDCRRAHQKHINDMICGDMANNPNKFWSYIKSKRCDNTGVASLFSDGKLHSDNISKTRLLNDQFSSVFTRTNTSGLPNLGPSPHPDIRRFDVTEEGVLKLLKNTNHHKAPGPDNIPGRLLKEGAIELSPIFTLLFNSTLHQGKIPSPWNKHMLHQYTRRTVGMIPLTTDLSPSLPSHAKLLNTLSIAKSLII